MATNCASRIGKSAATRTAPKLVAALLLGVTLLTTGCSAGQNSAEMAVTMPAAPAMPVPAPAAIGESAVQDAGFAYDSATGDANRELGQSQANREIIVTGFVDLLADDPTAAASSLASYVESIGGNVSARREWRSTPSSPGGASLTLRIPANRLNSVIDGLGGFGQVETVSIEQMDVTAQGQDLDARIAALQTSVTRLTDLLATAADTADLLAVERELSSRQAELDGLRAIRADLTGRVQLSTLDVNIRATAAAERQAEPSPGFLGGLERGWQAFVAFGRGLAVALGAVLPWLLAAGILAGIIVPLVRWIWKQLARRSRRAGVTIPSAPPKNGATGPAPRLDDEGDAAI